MTLLVGLGNPDLQYKNNRHNVGFMVIDAIIDDQSSCEKITKANFKGELFKTPSMLLLKPTTYMNLQEKVYVLWMIILSLIKLLLFMMI